MVASRLAIIGTGGFGREVLWASREKEPDEHDLLGERYLSGTPVPSIMSIAFVDDSIDLKGKMVCGTPVLGAIEEAQDDNYMFPTVFICGVGSNLLRRTFVQRVEKAFGEDRFYTIIHRSVEKSIFVEIGVGTVICAGATLTTQVVIGDHVNLNIDSTVSHNSVIEDYVNVSPGVHISGHCTLKEGCDIGTGANIMPHSVIGENSIIGAGACVTKDVPPNSVAVGVPARVVKTF